MATDDTILNLGSGGDTVRSLYDGTRKWPVEALAYTVTASPNNNALQLVTPSFGLPVSQATAADLNATVVGTGTFAVQASQSGSWTVGVSGTVPVSGTFWQATQPISGTVTANAGANLNTSTLALESGGHLASVDGKVPALGQALAASCVPVVLTAAQITTLTPLTTVAVTGTFWQATQPVSNAGTFAVQSAQSGTYTVQPGNTPNTTPWLANPHDPAATTGSITAADVAVSSASGQGGQSILTGSPTAGSFVAVTLSAETALNLQVSGTWSGTLAFERSMDGGTTYYPASMLLHGVGGSALSSITANCCLRTNVGGSTNFRVRCTAYVSGTPNITLQPAYGDALIAASLEAGTNLLGQISASDETSTIYEGTTALTPLIASFTLSSSGATQIVAATSGKKIRVLRYSVEFNSTVNFNFQSHATTSTASGTKYGIANKTSGGAYCPVGIFQAVAGEALDGNLSTSGTVSGELTYVLA